MTRATVSMERAAALDEPRDSGRRQRAHGAGAGLRAAWRGAGWTPALVIGVPVGFVNVVESKELLLTYRTAPYIVARGRKGGSNVAAAICNALLYQATGRRARRCAAAA